MMRTYGARHSTLIIEYTLEESGGMQVGVDEA
jgi:hypothetical protein